MILLNIYYLYIKFNFKLLYIVKNQLFMLNMQNKKPNIPVQEISTKVDTTTFQVDKCEKSPSSLETYPLIEKLEYKYFSIYRASIDLNTKLYFYGQNSFLQGYLMAYLNHCPITISPDIIWQIILIGFSTHIDKNSEKLRKKFVKFEGKQKLVFNSPKDEPYELTNSDWIEIFKSFKEQLNANVNEGIIDIIEPNFTTTTQITLTAAHASIMTSMKKYFDYEVHLCGCGFPYINLEGTIEDWEKVLNKINAIEKYDLKWWTKELKPIINEFIETKKGKINLDFWRNFTKCRTEEYDAGLSGMTVMETKRYIEGWIIKFFPYRVDGNRYNFVNIDDSKSIPSEIIECPIKLINSSGKEWDLKLYSGFLGMRQDPETKCCKSEIGWFLVGYDEKNK